MQLTTSSHTLSQISGLNSEVDVQLVVTNPTDYFKDDVDQLEYQKPAYIAVGLIIAMTLVSVLFPLLITSTVLGMTQNVYLKPPRTPCTDTCRFSLVESIPENLTFPDSSPRYPSTYDTWKNLILIANESIDIASFYWTLRSKENFGKTFPSAWQGEHIYNLTKKAGTESKIAIRIAQNKPAKEPSTDVDTNDLMKAGAAKVRTLDFTKLIGDGILHTKFWIVDKKHIYIGSANMDWRSLTQVKELGAVVYDCSCLAKDLQKIFEVYWTLGRPNATVPKHWPDKFDTKYNIDTPMTVAYNGTAKTQTFFGSSPPPFNPSGRTSDIIGLLHVIYTATEFVHIAVMDYSPCIVFDGPDKFWPIIDDAIRKVAIEKHIKVKLLMSWWNHSEPSMKNYLKSLQALDGMVIEKRKVSLEVRLFKVPTNKTFSKIPFARVNHNKYMVTDNTAYITTSNWSGDYFTYTGGVSLVINQTSTNTKNDIFMNETETIPQQLQGIFDRDWESGYAFPLGKSN